MSLSDYNEDGTLYWQTQGYTLGGSCDNAPNKQTGLGYQSDCNNWFVIKQNDGWQDFSSARDACKGCQSMSSGTDATGYKNKNKGGCRGSKVYLQNGKSANENAEIMANELDPSFSSSGLPDNSAEYFRKGRRGATGPRQVVVKSTKVKKYAIVPMIVFTLFILVAIGFYIMKRRAGQTPAPLKFGCGMTMRYR